MKNLESRFFTFDDVKETNIFYEIPDGWWSRIYEYPWAGSFVEESDIVLDAAAGVCHPFKYYLVDKAKSVHVIDQDERIMNADEVVKDIRHFVGDKQADEFDRTYVDKLKYKVGSIDKISARNKFFDKVFCISVFEHVSEEVQLGALKEFARILKDDGLIVFTVDYPDVTPDKLMRIVEEADLEFAGDVNFNIPNNAIKTNYLGRELKCFRAVLKKKV